MRELEDILKSNPDSIVFSRYAERLAENGRIDEAIDILNTGIQANPFYAPGHSVLADIHSIQGSTDEALNELETALSLDPQRPLDQFKLGEIYLLKNKADKATVYLWTAHHFEPTRDDVTEAFNNAEKLAGDPEDDLNLSSQSELALMELSGEEPSSETMIAPRPEASQDVIGDELSMDESSSLDDDSFEMEITGDSAPSAPAETMIMEAAPPSEIEDDSFDDLIAGTEDDEPSEDSDFSSETLVVGMDSDADLPAPDIEAENETMIMEAETAPMVAEEPTDEMMEDFAEETPSDDAGLSSETLIAGMDVEDDALPVDDDLTSETLVSSDMSAMVETDSLSDTDVEEPGTVDEEPDKKKLTEESESLDDLVDDEAELEFAELLGGDDLSMDDDEPAVSSTAETIMKMPTDDISDTGDMSTEDESDEPSFEEALTGDVSTFELEDADEDQAVTPDVNADISAPTESETDDEISVAEDYVDIPEQSTDATPITDTIEEDSVFTVEDVVEEEEPVIAEDAGGDDSIDVSDEVLPEVSDEEFDALLDEGAPEVEINAEENEEDAKDFEVVIGVESDANEEIGDFTEVCDDDFDSLIDECPPEVDASESEEPEAIDEPEDIDAPVEISAESVGDVDDPQTFEEVITEKVPNYTELYDSEDTPGEINLDGFTESSEEDESPAAADATLDSPEIPPFDVAEPESETDDEAMFIDMGEDTESFGDTKSFAEEVSDITVDLDETEESGPVVNEVLGAGSGEQPQIVNTLEIDDESDYNPDTFSYAGDTQDNDEPLISEEERAELLAYESAAEDVSGIPDEETGSAEFDVTDVSLDIDEELPGVADDAGESDGVQFESLYSDHSKEELDVLSGSKDDRQESDRALEEETKEGIDYSDVLSETAAKSGLDGDDNGSDIDIEEMLDEDDSHILRHPEALPVQEPEVDEPEPLTEYQIDVDDDSPTDISLDDAMVMEDVVVVDDVVDDAGDGDENVRMVEDLIKESPDSAIPPAGVFDEESPRETLTELINEYENSISEEPDVEGVVGPEVELVVDVEDVMNDDTTEDDSSFDGGETATMAEIYVSQGLFGKAIEIYESLLISSPDDEQMKSRIEELRELDEQQDG